MSSTGVPVVVPVTAGQFRTDFPEFSNTSVYPDSMVNYWLNAALILLNPVRWGRMLGTGIELFTAHNIKLEAENNADAALGNIPGITKGPVSAEGAGKVNVSYDVQAALDPKAQHWNLSNYGTRFWFLSRMMGAGPIHLSGCPLAGGASFSGGVFGPFGPIG